MRKLCTCVLLVALCLSLFAGCGGEQQEDTPAKSLSVGYARVDINPTTSLPLDGYAGNNAPKLRWSASTEWPLQAICVAFTDGEGDTVLVIALDMLNAFMADAMRNAVNGATGVPKENILFHCTHNHSGVALRISEPVVTEYITQLTNNVMSLAKNALEDRKPVTSAATTFARPEGVNKVRHYLLTSGEYVASTSASLSNGAKWYGHTTVADNLLQLVKFTREGGKDVVMVNWQAHPCAKIDKSIISTDYPGVLRDYLQTNLNCESIFILGGSGNLGNVTLIPGEMMRADSYDYQNLGRTLGADAVAAAANFAPLELGDIKVKEQQLLLNTRDGGALKVFLYAFSIGDFAMVSAPFEIFDTNAMAVKENSPYKMTFYSSCTNGSNGYLATEECYDWKQSYEANTSQFPKGTAEIIQENQQAMLTELFTLTGRTQSEKPEGYVRDPFVPVSDGVTYQILGSGTQDCMIAVQNGFYSFFVMEQSGSTKTLLVKDVELMNRIASMKTAQFLFDQQNVVVGIVE